MKFFIDTANLDQIREAYDMGVLDGVTTNPSLMAKEGIKGVENQRKHYVDICNIVRGDVSAEVIATDYEGMIKEGEELAALNPHHCGESALHCRRNKSHQIFFGKRYPYQLHTGVLRGAGFTGGKSRGNLRFAVCGAP